MQFSSKEIKNNLNAVSLPRLWPYRLIGNLFLLSTIFCLSIVVITIKEEIIYKKLFDLEQTFYDKTTNMGFTIDDIIIENREKTPLHEIQKILTQNKKLNILNTNPKEIKNSLEALPWIKKATVKRSFFPNIIQVSLEEKEVKAIWQHNNQFYPLDEEGEVINADYQPDRPVLLIVGKGAPENFKRLHDIIKTDNELFSRIKVANYISNRRWDIILDDIKTGVTIKLPEEGIEEAWKKFIKMNKSEGILKRKLTIIDLRLPDKVIVKLGKMTDKEKSQIKNSKESKT